MRGDETAVDCPPASERPIYQVQARITSIHLVGSDFVELTMRAPEIAGACGPGQFVMVRCADGLDPLLPRPFTIYQVDEADKLRVLVKKVGRGSAWLADKRVGDHLHVTGPLGHGFVISPHLKLAVLIAGGTGSAALGLLATALTQVGRCGGASLAGTVTPGGAVPPDGVWVLIGAHTHEECLCVDDFCGLCGEDGVRSWATREGLEEELQRLAATLGECSFGRDEVHIFAAGPLGMLRRVSQFAATHGLSCQLSVETRMACGVGVCQSCVCKEAHRDSYLLACADGPVFDSRALAL